MQRHLGGYSGQRLHQEVGSTHSSLDCTERMLDRLAPHAMNSGIRARTRARVQSLTGDG